ncbi:50S ribosomal protein L10 [Candidatus Gromoviella agglomerans]|uniref:50S ribosomal protein L10 n=1 Tax=Candidatus Gromoviella agglomerans TaxID=2806609 RepID=UPI001E4172B1|nr:50S ribosomal protein L10 [Candidatus Gromoviella agglomerans]UFX98548.1 50S ribosomal protein L10 [Candidatus Gromoviella agglomerans]
MNKLEKKEFVNNFERMLSENSFFVILSNNGLVFSEIFVLRRKLREVGAAVLFSKNTLASIALSRFGDKYSDLMKFLSNSIFMIFGNDSAAISRILNEFLKSTKVSFVLGGISTSGVLDAAEIECIGNVVSIDDARSKMISCLSSVGSKLACIMNALAKRS